MKLTKAQRVLLRKLGKSWPEFVRVRGKELVTAYALSRAQYVERGSWDLDGIPRRYRLTTSGHAAVAALKAKEAKR